jgi:hypothetical protein
MEKFSPWKIKAVIIAEFIQKTEHVIASDNLFNLKLPIINMYIMQFKIMPIIHINSGEKYDIISKAVNFVFIFKSSSFILYTSSINNIQ